MLASSDYRQQREEYARKAFPPTSIPHKLENLRGPGYSNILIRGFLLQGPHFGAGTTEIVNNLAPILAAGVTTFVCMQQELPTSATATATQTRSSYTGTNVVSAKSYMKEAQAMVDSGGFPQTGSAALSFVHYPIPPIGPGVLDDNLVRTLVLDLFSYMKAGEYLFLHCADGNGRSGTIAAILVGLAYNLGPVEAMALAAKSRNDRLGAAGASPETHEQRMQVHRLLSDKTLRTAAAGVNPRHSDPVQTETNAKLSIVLNKIRGIARKKGSASLIYLKRYAAKLTGNGSSAYGNIVTGNLNKTTYTKLCTDADWYLTAEESETLWLATCSAQGIPPSDASNASVDINTFFRVLRGPLPPRRAATVHDSFVRLSGSTGAASLDRIASAFNANQHPDVKANKRKVEEVTNEFLDTFGVQGRTERAMAGGSLRTVSAAEFEDYYADISPCIEDDAYFDLVIFGCWPSSATVSVPGSIGGPRARDSKSNPKITAAIGTVDSTGENGTTNNRSSIFVPELATGVRTITETGYTFVDRSNFETALTVLRNHLTRVGGFSVSYLGTALRRHDNDKDGMVDVLELRAALKDTVIACAHDSGLGPRARQTAAMVSNANAQGSSSSSSSSSSATEHPLVVSDADSDAIFTAVALKFTPRSLETPRPLIPLEAFHSALRGTLSEVRRTSILSMFNALDKAGNGAVPIAQVLVAFRAEEHPSVTAGRASVPSLYRQFQDSFGEGFGYIDKYGPVYRLQPGPAGEAYNGVGDNLVRLPYFETWFEGLSSQYSEDGDFNLVAFHILGGGNSNGLRVKNRTLSGAPTATTNFDPRAMAAKADDGEEGLLSSIAKLGNSRGANASSVNNNSNNNTNVNHRPGYTSNGNSFYGGNSTTTSNTNNPQNMVNYGYSGPTAMANLTTTPRSPRTIHIEKEGFTNTLSGLLPGPAANGPNHAPRGSGLASLTYQNNGTVPASPMRKGNNNSSSNSSSSSGFFANDLGVVNSSNPGDKYLNSVFRTRVPASTADPEYDSILNMLRTILKPRGVKGGMKLVRSLEQAIGILMQQQQNIPNINTNYLGSLTNPIPVHSFLAVLRDNSLTIPNRYMDTLVNKIDKNRQGYIVPLDFIDVLFGTLSVGRGEATKQAYSHVYNEAYRSQQDTSNSSTYDPSNRNIGPDNASVSLDFLRMSYSSSHHPEVKGGKRTEDDILREFLETFDGPTFTTANQVGTPGAFVSQQGFFDYYAIVSFFIPEDSHFTTLLFDTWALFSAPLPEHGINAPSAGKPLNYGGAYPTSSSSSSIEPKNHQGSVQALMNQGPARTTYSVRGPGQVMPSPSTYTGGYGVDGKVDLTVAKKGWGVERVGW